MHRTTASQLAEDPRPDLTADHDLWELVLSTAAERAGVEVLGLLHGLRCLGAMLHRQHGRRGAYLRLDYQAACGEIVDSESGALLWQPEAKQIREVWLEPHRNEIAGLFRAAISPED